MNKFQQAGWSGSCALALMLAAQPGMSAGAASSYETMAPLAQYLMPSPAEIALARSAAPADISGKATVLTLGSKGYESAVKGTNGFTCLVERGWLSPFDSPDFWSPKIRSPICYNPAASASVLKYALQRTQLVLAGDSKDKVLSEVRAAFARNELPSPEPGAMSFMMSKDGVVSGADGHWHSHLMFHVPKVAGETWGANMKGSPVVIDERYMAEPQTTFMVPVVAWSDGTASPPL